MKALHLPSYYQHKLNVLSATAKKVWKLKFFLPLLLLVACNNAPKDDGTKLPSLYTPPKSWEANPKVAYKVNMVTGRPVEPVTTVDGKPVITGIPIPAIGKRIHPDSIAKPKLIPLIPIRSDIKTMDNRYPVPDNLQQTPVDESKLIIHNAANSPQGYIIKNQFGDTIPTGKPIAAKGKTGKAFSPKINPALPLVSKKDVLYDIQYLNIDQGLPQQFVTSVFEDKDGYFWFGFNGSGVSRYDGKSFVVYGKENGLVQGDVRSIFQDKKGHLWFGTSGGVSRFDGKSFVNFTTAEGLAGNSVSKILEDKSGNLWFATNDGVSKFVPSKDASTGTFYNYSTNEGLSNNNVISMAEDQSGSLWFATWGGGVNKFVGKSQSAGQAGFIHFTTKEGLANDTVNSIIKDKLGHLWFSTRRGVSKFDARLNDKVGQGKTFTNFPIKLLAPNGRSNERVLSSTEDQYGHIWFGTANSGLIRYDGKNFIQISEKEGLSYNGVYYNSLFEDKSGHLWIGTSGGGLNRINTTSFLRFTKADGLSDNFIWNVLEDRKGNLWFGANTGINVYDGKSFAHFPLGFAYFSLEDKLGNLWFSGSGLNKYDGQSLVRYGLPKGVKDVLSMMEDSRGHLWLGGQGLTRYEPPKDGKSGTYFHFTEAEGFFTGGYTPAMLEDKSGNLWFNYRNGLTKYTPLKDGQSGTFVHFTAAEGLGTGIGKMLQDKNGYLWFATGNGLIRYEPSNQGHSGTFTHYTTDQGLPSNNLFSIFEDKQGILWIGTRDGLSKYDGKTFLNFTTAEGLSGNQVTRIMEDKFGNLWISTYGGGVSKLEKNAYKPSQQPPVVSLRQLYINEVVPDYRNPADSSLQKIKFDGVQDFENFPINPRIPSDQNHLSFQYSALDWNAPTKIKYSFRLLGLEKKWSIPVTRTTADFRNLPDGKFIFQVCAIGESGEWSKPFDYEFTILPPWWKTWWAYTIYALLFLTALRAFSLWREGRLRKEKEQLQHKVEERTSELRKKSEELTHSLEDLKSTQVQLIQSEKMASLGELTAGIAHEIQNPLNFVNNFSEVSNELIEELKGERLKVEGERDTVLEDELIVDISANLEKINHHGKRAADIVKGMLQHSSAGSGKKEPTNINALADEYLRLSYHGLRAKDKSFNATMKTEFDETIGNINIIPQDIGRVILNLITNAFYVVNERSKAEGVGHKEENELNPIPAYEPIVSVSTKKVNGKVEITVADNGNGIPQKILDKIFQPFFTTKPTGQGTGLGLSLSYDIVKAHGGTIEVESVEKEGTTFIVKLPIQNN
jgi:signal transduction histidine kinase/ligand-binding sensor domain-containing protein